VPRTFKVRGTSDQLSSKLRLFVCFKNNN